MTKPLNSRTTPCKFKKNYNYYFTYFESSQSWEQSKPEAIFFYIHLMMQISCTFILLPLSSKCFWIPIFHKNRNLNLRVVPDKILYKLGCPLTVSWSSRIRTSKLSSLTRWQVFFFFLPIHVFRIFKINWFSHPCILLPDHLSYRPKKCVNSMYYIQRYTGLTLNAHRGVSNPSSLMVNSCKLSCGNWTWTRSSSSLGFPLYEREI